MSVLVTELPNKIKKKITNTLLLSKMISFNCSEISTYEKKHVKLKNLLNILVKECKQF